MAEHGNDVDPSAPEPERFDFLPIRQKRDNLLLKHRGDEVREVEAK
jgi:hypothetical protein